MAKCTDANCTNPPTVTTVDSASPAGYSVSLAIGADGLPVIAYWILGFSDVIKVAKCLNAACTGTSTISTVVLISSGDAFRWSSIAVPADGNPVIAYRDGTIPPRGALRVAKCANPACTGSSTLTTVDAPSDLLGGYASIAIGADGFPVIAHFDNTIGALKLAKCANAACSSSTDVTVDSAIGLIVGVNPSVAVPADGLPVISYQDVTNQDLKIAKCGNAACSSGNTIATLDSLGGVGAYTSIAIGVDGLPIVSYADTVAFKLKVLHCGNAVCSSGNATTILDVIGGAQSTSIAMAQNGHPIIAYEKPTGLGLTLCANASCQMPSVLGVQISGAIFGDQIVGPLTNTSIPGTNVTGPLSALNVTNSATIGSDITIGGEYRYTTPRTKVYRVPYAAFFPLSSSTSYDTIGLFRYVNTASAGVGRLVAPVVLPDGGTVTQLSCNVTLSVGASTVRVWFQKDGFLNGLCSVTTNTPDINNIQTLTTSACSTPIVSGQVYTLLFESSTGATTCSPLSTCAISSCAISVTQSAAFP